MKGPRRDLLVVVVDKQLFRNADFVGFFGIKTHDEEYSDDGSNESSHVGEVVVDLIEFSGYFSALGSLIEGYVSHLRPSNHERSYSETILDSGNLLSLDLLPGHDAFISLDSADVDVALGGDS